MAEDPEKQSEAAEPNEVDDEEEEEPVALASPLCPRCGWHDTRPSHTKSILDSLLRTFSRHPYRCRSCGNRFHVFRRSGQI